MREITSFEDERERKRRFILSDGKWLVVDAREVQMFGLKDVLASHGYRDEVAEPLPLVWEGEVIGTVPGDFDVSNAHSRSELFSPRPGDFKIEGGRVIAHSSLGPGDIQAIVGFVPKKTPRDSTT